MTFDDFLNSLTSFDTDGMLNYLGQFDIGSYINNPWFLGAMGVIAVLCIIFKWRTLLAVVVGTTGLAWLVARTVERGTEIDGGLKSQNLLVFGGGAVLIVGLVIYLVFIKGE